MGQPDQQVLTASEKARTKWTRDKIISVLLQLQCAYSFSKSPKKDMWHSPTT